MNSMLIPITLGALVVYKARGSRRARRRAPRIPLPLRSRVRNCGPDTNCSACNAKQR